MRRRVLLVALAMSLVLAGCSKPVTARYETSVAGLPEIAATPIAFKAAEKKDTAVAIATSSGATGGSVVQSTSGTYYARVVGQGPLHGSNTAYLSLTVTRAGKAVSGAKATVTCTYVCAAGRQSRSYTMTTGSDGSATKEILATPYTLDTKVTISGYVLVDGSRVSINGIGFRVTGS
jgi:uncharacterized surface anchored protein